MRLRILHLSTARKLAVFCLALVASVFTTPAQDSADLRYLLVRRAGSPEKNYYEFARRLVGILDARSEFQGPFDVITEDPGTIRYGVYRIYRTRVLRETDSQKQPASLAEGAFVLLYRRDPDLKFCAKRYRFENEPSGARKITYTDFVDGREYSLRMTKDWPRPFSIYVVDVMTSDALHDLWLNSRKN
jgi:hypothetical protein